MKKEESVNPFGEKWEKEMNKHKKEVLINQYLKPLLEDKHAQSIIDAREGALVGFDATAAIIRKKLEKFTRQKKTSSLTIMVKPNSDGEYTGGIMGDVGDLIEGLFYMCKARPEVRTLFEYVVKALQEDDKNAKQEMEMETNVKSLYKHKIITKELFKLLTSKGIGDFKDLTNVVPGAIDKWIGNDSNVREELVKHMGNMGLNFGQGVEDVVNDELRRV